MTFSVTNRCNLRCSYCSIPDRGNDELSTADTIRLIDEFAEAGAQKLSFAGGEPLLRDDIGSLIERGKRKNLYLSLTTNGTLIKKHLSALKDLDTVLVSFDGPQAVHNLTGKARVSTLIEDILLLKKNNIHVCTSTVLTKPTIEHLDELLNISKKIALQLAFQPYSYIWYLSLAKTKTDGLTPALGLFKQAIAQIVREKQGGALINNSFPYLNLIKDGINRKVKECLAGKRYCYVDTNGDVYPCSPMTKRMSAENAVKIGFPKAFDKIQQFSCGDGCLFPCYLEYNFLFSLFLGSLANVCKAMRKS